MNRVKLIANGNGNGHSNGNGLVKPKLVKANSKKGVLEVYADELLKKIEPIICVRDGWYHYERGVWLVVDPNEYFPLALEVQNTPKTDKASKSILEYIRQSKQVNRRKLCGAIRNEGGHWLINCANFVLRIDAVTGHILTLAHSPDYMFTLQIASCYDVGAKCPLFVRTLREALPAEANRDLNLDFASSVLLPDSRFQCMLFCIGSGGNGKSTVWEAIAGSLGRDVVSRVAYHDLCANNRKYVWRLEHKLLNLGTETQAEPIDENAIIKAITCGEEFDTDRIYAESFPMKTSCKLTFLTNHPITYRAGSNAEVRRTRISDYGETFEGNAINRNLEGELTKERDGIFTMLVTRLARVIKLGEIGYGDANSQDLHSQFTVRNNPVLAFIKRCILEQDGYITKQKLWLVFKKFANRYETRPWSREAFYKKLYQIRPVMHRSETRIRVGGELTRVILGIGFSELAQVLIDEMEEHGTPRHTPEQS